MFGGSSVTPVVSRSLSRNLHGSPVAFLICFFISRPASSIVFSASRKTFFALSSRSI